MSNLTKIIASMPKELKIEVRKNWNSDKHAETYNKLEAFLMEQHCIHEDGNIYSIGKKVAGVC